jgi:hypothetical protein
MDSLLVLILLALAVPTLVVLARTPRFSLYLLVGTFPLVSLPEFMSTGNSLLSPQKLIGVPTVFLFMFDIMTNGRKLDLKGPLPLLTVLLFVFLLASHFVNSVAESSWVERYLANAIFVFLVLVWVENRDQLLKVGLVYVGVVLLAVLTTEMIPGYSWVPEGQRGDEGIWVRRMVASFGNPNTAAQAYLLGLGLGGAWLIAKAKTTRDWMLGLPMVIFMAYLLLATGARSAFLAFIVLVLSTVTIFLRSRGGRFGVVVLLVFSVWMVLDPPELMALRVKTIPFLTEEAREKDPEAKEPRALQYGFAIDQIADHPVFGLGPERFAAIYSQRVENRARVLHSWYLAAAADAGIPGLLAYLGLFFYSLRAFWQSAKAARNDRDRLARKFLAINLLATAVFGTFSSIPFNKFLFFLVGIAAAEWKLTRQELAAEAALDVSEEVAVVVQGRPLGSARRNAWRY